MQAFKRMALADGRHTGGVLIAAERITRANMDLAYKRGWVGALARPGQSQTGGVFAYPHKGYYARAASRERDWPVLELFQRDVTVELNAIQAVLKGRRPAEQLSTTRVNSALGSDLGILLLSQRFARPGVFERLERTANGFPFLHMEALAYGASRFQLGDTEQAFADLPGARHVVNVLLDTFEVPPSVAAQDAARQYFASDDREGQE